MVKIVRLTNVRIGRRLPFEKALQSVLEKSYELEVIFVSPNQMKALNKTYRKKNKTTNVLSFGLSRTQGQIFMEPELIKKEARALDQSFRERVWLLFLHGLLHLKGMDHEGSRKAAKRMEAAERKLLVKFSI